jgi:hypothetical protein
MATKFGKFRAVVVEPADPLGEGRLQVDIPAVGVQGAWAVACLPPMPVGLLKLPEAGATVWVEFEAGDVDFPVWSGVAWASGMSLPVAGTLTLDAVASVTVRAPQVRLESALVNADGLVVCSALNALTGVISPSYTPGAGNIW